MTKKKPLKLHHTRNYVREWRDSRKWSQATLAEMAGFAIASISNLETGAQGYSEDSLTAVAAAFGCHPSELLFGPPVYAPILGELRTLPQDRREVVVQALTEILGSLKKWQDGLIIPPR